MFPTYTKFDGFLENSVLKLVVSLVFTLPAPSSTGEVYWYMYYKSGQTIRFLKAMVEVCKFSSALNTKLLLPIDN